MVQELSLAPRLGGQVQSLNACEYRTVSKEGRITCLKIAEGEREVSPILCRACPFKAVNCAHLRFALRQISPSPLIVRFNGRTEIWNDDPPELRFEQAACAAKVMPIAHPRQCEGCALRQVLHTPPAQPLPRRRRQVVGAGKVVPFARREPALAAG